VLTDAARRLAALSQQRLAWTSRRGFAPNGSMVIYATQNNGRGVLAALGERRADAVEKFLVAEGVPANKLRRLSYGEERPADAGSNDRAWALNRRVELVY
jgi:peptidoglycan-associated lipoprotein